MTEDTANLGRQMAKGAAWMVAMRWSIRGIGIVSVVILARLLAPDDFGILAMAMIALFVHEAYSIFELYYLPMLFLGGQMFPIDLYPAWVQRLADWMPFYYTVGVPTEIFVGRIEVAEMARYLLLQLTWVLVMYIAFRLMWRFGLRQYTGVGM